MVSIVHHRNKFYLRYHCEDIILDPIWISNEHIRLLKKPLHDIVEQSLTSGEKFRSVAQNIWVIGQLFASKTQRTKSFDISN